MRIGTIAIDRVEDVDRSLENQIAHVGMTGVVRPARRRAAVFAVANRRIGAVPQQHRRSLGVAVERRGMERRVTSRAIDSRVGRDPGR